MKFMTLNRSIFILGLLLFTISSCKNNEEENVELENMEQEEQVFEEQLSDFREINEVVDAIEANPELSTFAAGLNVWNVEDSLEKIEGPYTIFAPTNTAYSAVYGQQGYDVLENNPDEVIPYHIILESFTPEKLRTKIQEANGTLTVPTAQGEDLTFKLEGNDIVLIGATGDRARVVETTSLNNGKAFIIDAVLLPEGLEREVQITTEN